MVQRFHIIVPAAGTGTRMAASLAAGEKQTVRRDLPKQYLPLAGKPILAHTLSRLHALQPTSLCLVVGEQDEYWRELDGSEKCIVTIGGASRADSVAAGLERLDPDDEDLILVHDAVRPLFLKQEVERLIDVASKSKAGAILAAPVIETLKFSDDGKAAARTEARQHYWLAQTPQAFFASVLRQALTQARSAGVEVTDEASAVEALGYCPALVPGTKHNIKITTAEDLVLAEFLLGREEHSCA